MNFTQNNNNVSINSVFTQVEFGICKSNPQISFISPLSIFLLLHYGIYFGILWTYSNRSDKRMYLIDLTAYWIWIITTSLANYFKFKDVWIGNDDIVNLKHECMMRNNDWVFPDANLIYIIYFGILFIFFKIKIDKYQSMGHGYKAMYFLVMILYMLLQVLFFRMSWVVLALNLAIAITLSCGFGLLFYKLYFHLVKNVPDMFEGETAWDGVIILSSDKLPGKDYVEMDNVTPIDEVLYNISPRKS